jgi:hypothetical protein
MLSDPPGCNSFICECHTSSTFILCPNVLTFLFVPSTSGLLRRLSCRTRVWRHVLRQSLWHDTECWRFFQGKERGTSMTLLGFWQEGKVICRRDIEHNPHKCLSNTPSCVQASASQPPDPHWKADLIFILQVGCRVSLHPLGGAEHKTTSFPIPCR